VSTNGFVFKDRCENGLLKEYYCQSDTEEGFERYSCPHGCENGRCLQGKDICHGLIENLKNPSDLGEYKFLWNYSYTQEYSGVEGHSSVWSDGKHYLYEQAILFNQSQDAEQALKSITSYALCQAKYLTAGGKEHKVYTCNWYQFEGEQTKQVLWTQDNVLVQMTRYLSRAEADAAAGEQIDQLLKDLRDNRYKISEDVSLDPVLQRFAEQALGGCPSDNKNICVPKWNCKTEPVICPEYGLQKRRCVDSAGCTLRDHEESIYCSPGICSGCYVPRWIWSKDNICIPYGFRFEYTSKPERLESERVEAGAKGDYSLEIVSDQQAILVLYGKDSNTTYTLIEGTEVEIVLSDWDEDIGTIILYVRDVGQDYVDVDIRIVPKKINAYCDIDGVVKMQRIKDRGGNWAKCQNSYECDSNVCSSGECVEIADTIRKVKGFKALFARVLCRVANLFNNEEYQGCLAQFGVEASVSSGEPSQVPTNEEVKAAAQDQTTGSTSSSSGRVYQFSSAQLEKGFTVSLRLGEGFEVPFEGKNYLYVLSALSADSATLLRNGQKTLLTFVKKNIDLNSDGSIDTVFTLESVKNQVATIRIEREVAIETFTAQNPPARQGDQKVPSPSSAVDQDQKDAGSDAALKLYMIITLVIVFAIVGIAGYIAYLHFRKKKD